MSVHIPVLKNELIEGLDLNKDDVVVDCTLGGGGHAIEVINILEEQGGGTFIGIDLDEEAIENFKEKSSKFKKVKIELVNGNFSNLGEILENLKIEKVDKIYADLGFSSDQIDEITFRKDKELDLRMDKSLMVKAKDLLNGLYKNEIEKLFREYGDVEYAKPLAREIELYKRTKLLERTTQLNAIVKTVLNNARRSHIVDKELPRVYQALRIAVNGEYKNLENLLETGIDKLDKDGRFAIISFHSGEDRIVKKKFKENIKTNNFEWVRELVIPTHVEIGMNPKSRSAKLRILHKI